MVQATEPPFTVVKEITPQSRIYKGDMFSISSTVTNSSTDPYFNSGDPTFELYRGEEKVVSKTDEFNHRMMALASGPQKFECRFSIRYVEINTTKMVLVSGEWIFRDLELFCMVSLIQ